MNILVIIFSVLSVFILLGLLFKPKYGALLYIIYMYLAPWIYIGGFQIYSRTLAFIFLALFFVLFLGKYHLKDLKPLMPYTIFLLFNFFLLLFAERFTESLQWYMFTICDFFFILFLYVNILNDRKVASLYKWTLYGVFCAITAYGLFLTTIPGINPFKLMQMPLFGGDFNEAYAAGNSALLGDTTIAEGRMFGRISSVFDHPMTYGLNLGFFLIFSLYILKDKPKILYPTLLCIVIAVITCGVRTAIAALIITAIFALFYLHKVRYAWYGIVLFAVMVLILPLISESAESYIASIFNSNDSETQGSSLSMRLTQLEGCFDIVKDNPFFGKGYGWHYWFNAKFGAHPKALYFESLFFTILVETGIVGFFTWSVFILKQSKFIKEFSQDRLYRCCLFSLMVYYLVYSLITGDMGIKNMMIFYVILVGVNLNKVKG